MTSPPRGYLMIETIVASAVLSIALGTMVSLLTDVRRRASANANEVTAMQLARAKAEELVASPHVVVPQNDFEVVDADLPGFRWRWRVTQAGLQTNSVPQLRTADSLHEVVVAIEFPSSTNDRAVTEYRRFKVRR